MAEEEPKKAVYCPICGAKRWTVKQLENHIKKKHGEKKK